jgi:hypothetical protein
MHYIKHNVQKNCQICINTSEISSYKLLMKTTFDIHFHSLPIRTENRSTYSQNVRFEAFTAATVKNAVLWDI